MLGEMKKTMYIKNRGIIGPAPGYVKVIRILDRMLTWKESGLEYEADQRHADKIIQDLGLGDSTAVTSPGVQPNVQDNDDDYMEREEAKIYRGIVARANYLTQDRSEIQYSTKELSRTMANPRKKKQIGKQAERLGNMLIGRQRYITQYPYQKRG